MARRRQFLAIDLGAESGRAVLGVLEDGKITLEVLHRFRTEGLTILGTRQWDYARIYEEIVAALRMLARRGISSPDGIGVDTWGVDFALVAADGSVLGNPVAYRDKRTEGMQEYAFQRVPREEIYRITGIQFLPFNTVYQLLSLVKKESPILAAAERLLLMGDFFAYLLSGRASCEYTNASTSQLINARAKDWDYGLIERLGLPRRIFQELIPPGTVINSLHPQLVAETGLAAHTRIIAPATHDTASAVAAVPVTEPQTPWAYLSSGTWSLLGAELPAPHITQESLEADFTNEGGVFGTIRFLKNIFGLWLVQECRRQWEKEGETLTYAQLTAEAAQSSPFVAAISLDDSRLLAPDNMPQMIQTLCREAGQPVPQTRGEIVRCALESLALKYRQTLRAMDKILGRTTQRLHLIGGGVQNTLLCQMTADACGIPVIAGPIEATALGNIGMQAVAVGAVRDHEELRRIIAHSVEPVVYAPKNTDAWDRFAERMGISA